MDPGPDHEHHHHHHTGHRWLDIVLGVCAMIVSVVSLCVAIEHGRTMERMVEANTWPYLDFTTSNTDETGTRAVSFQVGDVGVGPAKVESFQIFYAGRPVASGRALIDACCAGVRGEPVIHYYLSTVSDRVIGVGGAIKAFSVGPHDATPDQIDRLDLARHKLWAELCYCSVLDQCWTRDTRAQAPVRLKGACPRPALPYEPEH